MTTFDVRSSRRIPPAEPAPTLFSQREIRPRRSIFPWFRRLGWAGFVFFLVKGLMWLAAPGVILWWRSHVG